MRRITLTCFAWLLILLGLTGFAAAQNVTIPISASSSKLNNLRPGFAPAPVWVIDSDGKPCLPPPIDSSQPDTIKYDIGGSTYLYGPSNLWGIVRFTAPSLFELRCLYIQMLNINSVDDGIEVYVYDDNGSGLPGALISGPYFISGPLFLGYTWLDVEIDQPYPTLAANQDFFVVFGPAPTGPPSQGWFLFIDSNGNTENRSGYGMSQQGPWYFTSLLGDLIIRAGGILSGGPQSLTIALTPISPPIQIPATGGDFSYNIAASNPDTATQRFSVWCMVTLPNGNPYGPVLGPVTITLNPGQTLERLRIQTVPAGAPQGNYDFNAYIGVYPDSIWDSDTFPFEKSGAGGVEHWVALYNGPANDYDVAYGLAVDQAGNVYVTGLSVGIGSGVSDYATIKYNSAGMQQWVARYAGPWEDSPSGGIALDLEGNVYVTGYSDQGPAGYVANYATIKYDNSGNQQWVAEYDGPSNGNDYANDVAVDQAGNVYVTGASVSITSYDYATIKYDSLENQIWVARYNGTGNSSDGADCIALDSAGNVYVAGSSEGGSQTGYDYVAIKYDSMGNQLWVARYSGQGAAYDELSSLALDGNGNVYLTGVSDGGVTEYDFATVKYDSSGNQLWVARYNGPANSYDFANSLALGSNGDVYVTGSAWFNLTAPDYVTIKYDTFGNQVWIVSYDGPGNSEDNAWSVALDLSGNVYVTGNSTGDSSTGVDYATIKYNGEGNQIWVSRFDGSANDWDGAGWIALDATGHVYVAGASDTDPSNLTNYDFCTIKYSGGNIDNWLPVEATVLGQPLPQEFALHQNYPNPFNASTVLSYQLPVASHVKLEVFDITGRAVGAQHAAPLPLVDGWRTAGEHELTFDASDLPSGMYFARLEAGDYAGVQKLILLK